MASSEADNHQRNCNRSVSENNKKEIEEDYENSTRPIIKSETQDNLQELEEIVTCGIHLGIMIDPRKLFCQHAFCYDCLKKYFKKYSELICPICRAREKIPDVDKLPSALTEKQLIDVVMKHRLNKCIQNPQNSVDLTDDSKEELVKHLLKGINFENGIYKVSDKGDVFSSEDPEDRENIINSHTGSTTSLVYIQMDIETIQENMLKHSKYQIMTRNVVQRAYKDLYHNKSDGVPLNFSILDITIASYNHSRSTQFVLVDCNSYKLIVYSESQFRTFHICLEDKIVQPEYIKFHRGDLIMSGRLESNTGIISVFLQCNTYGQITRQSDHYSWSDLSCLPMMLGFDFNQKEDKYYLCMPKTGTVRIYNALFVESQRPYELDDNKPEYVAFSSSQNQLWVSCPANQRILILDIDSGGIRSIDTEQIDHSIPKMIFITDDEKILFLDTHGNRIIWVKRRNEYILTQKLNIPSLYRDLNMKTFQVLPFSMVVIGVDKEILIFQSKRDISRSRRIFESCNVL